MRYEFILTGTRALFMHYDDVEWADEIGNWRIDPENTKKAGEKSGDDRRPAWTWVGYCYQDGTNLVIPGANLTSCLKKAGARVPLGRQKTFKELAVSGILIEDEFLAFFNNGQQVPFEPLLKMTPYGSKDGKGEGDFKRHIELSEKLGFRLSVKRAPVGASKHVRVRPRFDQWQVKGTLETLAHEITPDVLEMLFTQAGRVGLGDWRPGSPKSPGPFGMFETKLKPLK